MDLTDEQKEAVAGWVIDGASLADVQKRLLHEFSVTMTYMDVRFVVDDLDLSLKDREPAVSRNLEDAQSSGSNQNPPGDDLGGGRVKVELDRVLKPGSLVSGSVVFSDGMSATWSVDQLGRLSLDPKTKGYRPGPEDLQEFQLQLQSALQGAG